MRAERIPRTVFLEGKAPSAPICPGQEHPVPQIIGIYRQAISIANSSVQAEPRIPPIPATARNLGRTRERVEGAGMFSAGQAGAGRCMTGQQPRKDG